MTLRFNFITHPCTRLALMCSDQLGEVFHHLTYRIFLNTNFLVKSRLTKHMTAFLAVKKTCF